MGRQQNKIVKRAAGVPVKNYSSKTSPSHLKYQEHRKKPTGLGRPLYRYHKKRNDLKAQLAKELGLPPNTKFIFRSKSNDVDDIDEEELIEIYYGTVVVIDKEDLSVVLVVRCTPFSSMDSKLREQFDNTISTTFLHARARNLCKVNGAHKDKKDDEEEHVVCGCMACCGWRGGSDFERSLGAYAVSAFTATTEDRLLTDLERMTRFHIIRDFLAERLSTLSLSIFKTNLALALEARVPGFDELEWQDTPNSRVFASNMVVTWDGFSNRMHTDKDHSRYASGLWCLIDRKTGNPIEAKEAKKLGSVDGACFVVKRYGVKVVLSRCDGMYEMLWDVKVPHYTSTSISRNAKGKVIEHKDCDVTLYASSCQISASLVNRIRILEKEKEGLSDADWQILKKKRVKSYGDENDGKMKKIKLKKKSFENENTLEMAKVNVKKNDKKRVNT